MEDKVALITGGSSGIGRDISHKLAGEGYHCVIFDVKSGEDVVEDIKNEGGRALFKKVDITDFQEIQRNIKDIESDIGPVNILVNNAGITRDNLLIRMREEDWDQVIDVNLKGVFNCTKAVLRSMMKERWGRIVSISSIIGLMGNAGQSNYSASKAGIIGFTKSIAKELGARNIRSNAIAPGFIETDMTANLPEEVIKEWYEKIPLKRGGKPDDVANACVFFGSDLSSYVQGNA